MDKETKFKRVKIHTEDHAALRIMAAQWGWSMQKTLSHLIEWSASVPPPAVASEIERMTIHKLKPNAAISSEGGEDLGHE